MNLRSLAKRGFNGIIVLTVLISSLSFSQTNNNTVRSALPQQQLGTNKIVEGFLADLSKKKNYTFIGVGSWITGKKYRDPLTTASSLTPSDQDMRLLMPTGTKPEEALKQWKNAANELAESVEQKFGKGTPEAEKVLKSINLYPPEQLMVGVKNNTEALGRCVQYGQVPNLALRGTPVTAEMNALEAIGGIYGEGSSSSRAYRELMDGRVIFTENGKTIITRPDLHIVQQGIESFTATGMANTTQQWREFAQYWVSKGDGKMSGKYLQRMADDLNKARDLSRFSSSPVVTELREISAQLVKGKVQLSEVEERIAALIQQVDRQTLVIQKLGNTSPLQAKLIDRIFAESEKRGGKYSTMLNEVIEKIGMEAFLKATVAAIYTEEAVQAAGKGDCGKVWANAVWLVGALPEGILVELTQYMLETAKDVGFTMAANSQSCSDLLAGIYTPEGRAKADGPTYTIDQLVDEYKDEVGLRNKIYSIAIQAADRGFTGPAVEESDWNTAEKIVDKCYPVIFQQWDEKRQVLLIQYNQLWEVLANQPVALEADPNPAYLDQDRKADVTVTAVPMGGNFPEVRKQIADLAYKLSGNQDVVVDFYDKWTKGGEGKGDSRIYTFTSPGEYPLRVYHYQTFFTSSNVPSKLAYLRKSVRMLGEVTVQVYDKDELQNCGGEVLVKSSANATIDRKDIPSVPGEISTPRNLMTSSGSFTPLPDTSCMPDVKFGPFEVSASGKLRGVLKSDKQVPIVWSVGNWNTGLVAYFEPMVRGQYVSGGKILEMGGYTEGGDKPLNQTQEVSWTGAGRITVRISHPSGAGEFHGECYTQSYSAILDIVAFDTKEEVKGGTRLNSGDIISTGPNGYALITLPPGRILRLGPNTQIKFESIPSAEDPSCKETIVNVVKGRVDYVSGKDASGDPPVFKARGKKLKPKGTEFTVTIGETEDQDNLSVVDGSVGVEGEEGAAFDILAGKQTTLAGGEVTDYDISTFDGAAMDDIPLRDQVLDDDLPAEYGVFDPFFMDDAIPEDWVWEDPGKDVKIVTPDYETLQLTVPDGNDLYQNKTNAPRLLHRVTGDFDLRSQVLLETKSTDFSGVGFLVKSPGSNIGTLTGQIDAGKVTSDYFQFSDGLAISVNTARIVCGLTHWQTDCPEMPKEPVFLRLVRQGAYFSSYWSLDGIQWNWSTSEDLNLPETVWVGYTFKRAAYDGMPDEPAIATLKDVRLSIAPSGEIPVDEWEVIANDGTVNLEENYAQLTLDGSKLGAVTVAQGEILEGDLDVITSFNLEDWTDVTGQSQEILFWVRTLDQKNQIHASAFKVDGATFYGTDMVINAYANRWNRVDNQGEIDGRLRILRKDGYFHTFFWNGLGWTQFDTQFGRDLMTAPVKIVVGIQNKWNATTPGPVKVDFTIEQVATGDEVPSSIYWNDSTGDLAFLKPVSMSSEYEGFPAVRGVDGVKDGTLNDGGFSTLSEENPWWQVDLGQECMLDKIVIFNRTDCCQERVKTLQVDTSLDQETWDQVFSNDGTIFSGGKGKPLEITLDAKQAQYVRVRLNGTEYLNLDEVEVFGFCQP